ncbi:acyl--CoA ligase [Lactovum odontotermitis]
MTKLLDTLQNNLKKYSDKELLVSLVENRSWTGAELAGTIEQTRKILSEAKIGADDVVVLALSNTALYPILEQALWELGAVPHPLAPSTPLPIIEAELAEYDYKSLIVDEGYAGIFVQDESFDNFSFTVDKIFVHFFVRKDKTPKFPSTRSEDDLALILNTSGTTGKPKRVGINFRKIWLAAQINMQAHHVDDTKTGLVIMPMFHVNAQIVSTVTTRVAGGKLVIAEKFSARRFWKDAADYQVDWTCVVPTIVKILVENQNSREEFEKYRGQIRLSFVKSSSFSLPENFIGAFEEDFGVRVMEGYGMTEATTIVTVNPLDAAKIGSVGTSVGTEIKLYDLAKHEIFEDPNRAGEVVLKGPRVMESYMDPKPDSHVDGWFRTGDIGRFDEEHYLFIVGRIKEIINHGGEHVVPARVESVLSVVDFVKDVAVIGLPDSLYGEEVVAAVIADGNAGNQEEMREKLNARALETLAKHERPARYFFVEHFPLNPTGKVLREALAKEIQEELGKEAGKGA